MQPTIKNKPAKKKLVFVYIIYFFYALMYISHRAK